MNFLKEKFDLDKTQSFLEVQIWSTIRSLEPEVARSWIYVTILSMSMLWSVARVDRKKIEFSGF